MIDAGVIERAIGRRPSRIEPIGGGAAGSVHRLYFTNGSTLVAKTSDGRGAGLDVEGRLLRLLAERSSLPVPRVEHADASLLIMQDMPGRSAFDERSEQHAAELLAALHDIGSPDGRYGLEFDGVIGPLAQPNSASTSWVEFFRNRRLLHMGREAAREGALPAPLGKRLERLATALGDLIPDRPYASLVHGDVWSGNVLAEGGRVTAFLDPAAHYADAEVDLAFITLFSTFGRAFFERYHELRPIAPGFREMRRHVYNTYPLLVHVRLFGGAYVSSLDSTLAAVGF